MGSRRRPSLLWLVASLPHAACATCGDGTAVPDAWIDDDYCDCPDNGADEPSTGACPETKLTCANAPHTPSSVFASRVNDGVCDCCDGHDEWRRGGCPNTCVDLAKVDLATAGRAALLRAEREKKGLEAATERARRLSDARASLANAEPQLAAATKAKADAEAAEAAARQRRDERLASGEVAAALRLDDLSAELVYVALARLTISLQVTGADALHDKLSALEAISEDMEDVDSADLIEVAYEAKEAASTYDSEGADADEAQNAPQACAAAGGTCGFEADLLKLLPLAKLARPVLTELVLSYATEHGQMAFLAEVCAALLRGSGGPTPDGAAVASALALLEPFHDAVAEAARSAHASLEKTLHKERQALEELEPVEAIAADFGVGMGWHALHANCYTHRDGAFEYRLCPFGSFTQDGRSLGTYAGWHKAPADCAASGGGGGAAEMAFENGEQCDGRPRRALVRFTCAEEDALKSVSEPSTCAYEATFETPSACTNDELRTQHEALAEAAKAAGLPYEPDADVRAVLGL